MQKNARKYCYKKSETNVKRSPRVSVLMPVYKTKPEYLKKAIESILSQTFKDFELLILDDYPKDPREKIVTSYKDIRIKYAQNDKNYGISYSRNKLIDMAQGEYLAIFDHDDISLPNRLEKEVEYLDTHLDVGVCGSAFSWTDKNEIKNNPISSKSIEKMLMCECAIHHSSAMVRKSLLLEHNIKYESEYFPAEDYALWCRLIGKTKFHNFWDVLVLYRKYPNQTSNLRKNDMKRSTQKIRDFVRKDNPDIWNKVQNDAMSIVRVKLFGLIPLGKFRHIGLHYNGFLNHIPFISIKTKMALLK